jgi:hypothetical protein
MRLPDVERAAHGRPVVGVAGGRNDGFLGGLWAYFAPHGVATQWYWPPGTRGKLHNWLHGKGWRIG